MKEVSSSHRHGFFRRAHCNLNLGLTFGAVVAALSFGLLPSRAVPYASGVVNNAGTVSFILNEDADNVTVIFDGGPASSDLGALGKGTHSFNLGAATSFQIKVSKVGGAGYRQGVTNQLSADTNQFVRFVNQRGVSVNKNPASPLFGRVYVSVSQGGTATGGRVLTDGIYLLNADLTDAVGQGDTARTGGIDFANPSPNAESPHRITVGPDNNLYIGDWSDTSGSVYVTDGDVSPGSGMNVLGGPVGSAFPLTSASGKLHGSISGTVVEGSLQDGNLTVYVIDEDLQSNKDSATQNERNSIWRWDIGAGPLPATGPPVKVSSAGITFASQLADFVRGPDGKFYKTQRRAEPADPTGSSPNLLVVSSDGSTLLWSSIVKSRELLGGSNTNTDLINETCAVDISPDGRYLATLRRDTNSIILLPLTDGIPNLTNRIIIPTLPSTGVGRDLSFDAAGNLYVVSSGQGVLRVYAPGGTTMATTGSDGTFTVVTVELPEVSVMATDPVGSEDGPDEVVFQLSRTGDLSQPLTVEYSLNGTAVNGTDYQTNTLSVTFEAGAATASVTNIPVDDAIAELAESIILTILPTTNYSIAPIRSSATATIVDNEYPNVLTIVPVKASVYEPYPSDTASFTITRYGNTNVDVFLSYAASGSATLGVDYSVLSGPISILPGEVTITITISPTDDLEYEGNETVTFTLMDDNNPDFDAGVPGAASVTIRDDDYPAACVLFSEGFDTADSQNNWALRFGANNGIEDFTAVFGFDYVANSIPTPPNGSTHGLLLSVNKNDATALGSAGINLYPIGQSFSNDYALRFDMYLQFGTAGTTEHALAGLNHSGNLTNRVTQNTNTASIESTRGGDGIFVAIETDGSANREYGAYSFTAPNTLPLLLTNRSAAAMAPFVTSPPFSFVGSPGNGTTAGSVRSWAKVELAQRNNNITLRVNNAVVYTLTNTYGFTSGNIMIGHNDQFDSVGSSGVVGNLVLIDNVQVVQLGLRIKRIELLPGSQVAIDFVSPDGGLAGDFHLQSTASLNDPIGWADDNTAVITATPDGFRATTSHSGAMTYYQIRR